LEPLAEESGAMIGFTPGTETRFGCLRRCWRGATAMRNRRTAVKRMPWRVPVEVV